MESLPTTNHSSLSPSTQRRLHNTIPDLILEQEADVPRHHHHEGLANRRGYFLAELDDQTGIPLHGHPTKQFKIEVGSEVRFRIKRGGPLTIDTYLLVNKPKRPHHAFSGFSSAEDEINTNGGAGEQHLPLVEFTVTQPMKRRTANESQNSQRRQRESTLKSPGVFADSELFPNEEDKKDDLESKEDRQSSYKGSTIEKAYLDRIPPFHSDQSVNLEFRVDFLEAGTFFLQLEYFDKVLNDVNYTEPFYINVEPVLVVRNQKVRVKELSIMTVLARCLGPVETRWEGMYDNISALGYNAIHFTPIQKYGASYSHYSLADQTLIDDYFFTDHPNKQDLTKEERIGLLKAKVEYLKEEYRMLGIVDIVLNHTANNSEWLLHHPEAAYNTRDCPHLASAYAFDKAISDFSDDFANRRNVNECPSAPYINNESDLKAVLNAIQNRVINRLNLHEYFLYQVEETLQEVRKIIKDELKNASIQKYEALFEKDKLKDRYSLLRDTFVEKLGERRYGAAISRRGIAFFYLANGKNEDGTVNMLRPMLNKLNDEWRGRVGEFMKEAIKSLEGDIRYHKIDQRKSQITATNKIVSRYFSELNNSERSQVAHNGWIMNAKPLEDFAMTGWHYLRRSINIWGDSVKLRYGDCPADSPFLWNHMSEYVSTMASVFDGFRLDNAHSTPIHVCYYLLQAARSSNPNLFVMAELFTSSAEADAMFVRKLNINGLIREMQNTSSAQHLGAFFHEVTCREAVIGLVDQASEDVGTGERYQILKSTRPNDILYDCTHDNPSPFEKFRTGRIALSHLAVAAMADLPIASTWGYDQLLPYTLNVVTERRLYQHYENDQREIFAYDCANPQDHKLSYHKHILMHGAAQESEQRTTPERTPEVKHEFEYEFTFTSNWAKRIQIAGEFTLWKPLYDMHRASGSDLWTFKATFPIVQGENSYQYKFVIDGGNWMINERLPQSRDKSGNVNNLLEVPQSLRSQQPKPSQPKCLSGDYFELPDIRMARRILNRVHEECARENAEIFLHEQSSDVLVIIRQLPLDHSYDYDAYVCITRHPYYNEGGDYSYPQTIELPGLFADVVFCGFLEINKDQDYKSCDNDPKYIKSASAKLKAYKSLDQFCRIEKVPESNGQRDRLVFWKMPPSFTLVVKTRYPALMKESVRFLNGLKDNVTTEDLARQLLSRAPLTAINHLLFRCDNEEKEVSKGQRGPYGLQNGGPFTYGGIASFMTLYRKLKVSRDMGHELFENMRQGDWYLEYARDRLRDPEFTSDELDPIRDYLCECIKHIKTLAATFKPKYGARVLEKLYNAAVYEVTQVRMTDRFVNLCADEAFVQRLALAALQQFGRVPSAQFQGHRDTMAAGLPHFATGYMRCWGRDTFISMRGLMISTGLWAEAKDIIIQFAKVIRHGGLIPNLHDRGNNTRFNARDATWFFFQAVKDYYNAVCEKEGIDEANAFLTETEVEMHYRDQHDQRVNNEKRHEPPRKATLATLLHEILQAHASGIKFREWNAGTQIDGEMKDEGFNVQITLNRDTGFLHGGNINNCGTWMDKMGSAYSNKGVPATPRDGAPIELVALLHSSLNFMSQLNANGAIETDGVVLSDGSAHWTYREWAQRINANFERCFWVPETQGEDHNHDIAKQYVNRRGIYKDVYGSTHKYTDYQLRPNLCVAMAYAPELFENDHAKTCLKAVETVLMERGCMGIKTLDPSDKNYRGDYVNSDETRGWNYHQGPEWVWPVGFFLKAKMIFERYDYPDELRYEIMQWLLPHQQHIIVDSPWEGLPELTNSHGKHCPDSCTTQAWSIATVLDALRDLHYS